jgi:hypothetical protein
MILLLYGKDTEPFVGIAKVNQVAQPAYNCRQPGADPAMRSGTIA